MSSTCKIESGWGSLNAKILIWFLAMLFGGVSSVFAQNKCDGVAGYIDPLTSKVNYKSGEKVVYKGHLWTANSGGAYGGQYPGYFQSNVGYFWTDKGACIDLKLNLDSSAISSATNVSSSSQNVIRNTPQWIPEKVRTTRCDFDGVAQKSGTKTCFDPTILEGAKITLPANVTRISKNMLTLCNLKTEKSLPLAVVYVWDNSGSMSAKERSIKDSFQLNDPDTIAPKALSQALHKHLELDSLARVGIVKFGTAIYDSIPLVRLGLDSNLTQIQSWLRYDDAGGTNYQKALLKARDYLQSSRLQGYRKVIILVSDGLPQDTLATLKSLDSARLGQTAPFPEIYSVFLNQNAADRAAGEAFLKKLAINTALDSLNPPTVTPIAQASDMSLVIQNLLVKLVQKQNPTALEMTHLGMNKTIQASGSQLIMQADSTWNVPLDTTLALVSGENQIRLTTRYGKSGLDSLYSQVNFRIVIDSTFASGEFEILGTPFKTICYEPNSILIYGTSGKGQPILQKDSVITLHFNTTEAFGFGNEVKIRLHSLAQDSLWVTLPLLNKSATGAEYSAQIKVKWTTDSTTSGEWVISPFDTLSAFWVHPLDARDGAYAQNTVILPVPKPRAAIALDQNEDGVLDHICIEMNGKIEAWMPRVFQFNWKAKVNQIWKSFNLVQDGSFALRDSIFCWEAPLSLSKSTSLLDSSRFLYPSLIKIEDKMKPILDSARILYTNKERTLGDLLLTFTEDILSDSVQINPAFDFWTKNKFAPNILYSSSKWSKNVLKIPMNFADSTQFYLLPQDSIRPKVNALGVQDLEKNLSSDKHPWVPVIGELPYFYKANYLVESNVGWSQDEQNPHLNIQAIQPEVSTETAYQNLIQNQKMGFIFGSIRFDSTSLSLNHKIPYQVYIYDHIGQAVFNESSVIDCDLPEFKTTCFSNSGARFIFDWNLQSSNGRPVASGVYLWSIQIEHYKFSFKTGVHVKK